MNTLKLIVILCALSALHVIDAKNKQESAEAHHQKSEPEYLKIATPILATASQTLQTAKSEGWDPSKLAQMQWFSKGILLKYIINQAQNTYVEQAIQPLKERVQQLETSINELQKKNVRKNKAQLAKLKEEKKKLEGEQDQTKIEAGMFATAAGKFIEDTIKQAIQAFMTTIAPSSYVDIMKTALNTGLRFWIATDVAGSLITMAFDEIAKQSKPATLQWDWYPYAPLQPTHTTAIYCGPKDPYCLHGAKQLDVNETLSLIGQQLASTIQGAALPVVSVVTGAFSHYVGSALGSLPKTVGQFINTLVETQQIPWLIDFIKTIQPATKALGPLLKATQRYLEHYIPFTTYQTLNTLFDDLNIKLTDAQKNAFKKEYMTAAKARGLYAGSEEIDKFVANLQVS